MIESCTSSMCSDPATQPTSTTHLRSLSIRSAVNGAVSETAHVSKSETQRSFPSIDEEFEGEDDDEEDDASADGETVSAANDDDDDSHAAAVAVVVAVADADAEEDEEVEGIVMESTLLYTPI